MFLTLTGKAENSSLDISVLLEFSPDTVTDFFQHRRINISLDTYRALKQQFDDPENFNENVSRWVLFIDKLLNLESDLETLEENAFLRSVGPAYYTKTNTRFYFFKPPLDNECITANDIKTLIELNQTPCVEEEIAQYYANLKCRPITRRSREDLLRDLNICRQALLATETVHRQIAFQEAIISEREKFLNAPYTALVEPDKPGDKPEKPNIRVMRLKGWLGRNRQNSMSFEEACIQYNNNLKAYYINYREYEKACDRYKVALKEWEEEKNNLINRSIEDIKKARLKIKKGNRVLKVYNEVLKSLDIHHSYHNLAAIARFCYFLETGRASTLQECMNLYEMEMYWADFKESQARIERNILATVHYLYNEAAAASDNKPTEPPEGWFEQLIKKIKIKEGWKESP